MTRFVLMFTALLCVSACALPTGSQDGIPEIRVLNSSVVAGDTVRATLINRSAERLLSGSCDLALERRAGDAWTTALPDRHQVCTAVGYGILPGGSAARKLTLPPSLPSGEYRLRQTFMLGSKQPEKQIVSQPFTVVART